MTNYLCLDTETSIGKTVHGPDFRDPENDVYTQIWAVHPKRVYVEHNKHGWGRTLCTRAAQAVDEADCIVGHNLSFDLCYVWHTQEIKDFILRGGKIWDCQLAEYLLTGQQHSFASLAELQEKYLGKKIKPNRISFLYQKGIGADKILAKQTQCPRLFKLYNEYCVSDGSTPLRIMQRQYNRAKSEGMLEIIELYNDYLLSIINMTCTGIKLDVTTTEKTLTEFNLKALEYLEQAQEILKSVWTDERLPPFNINSTIHKSAVLFGGTITVDIKQEAGHFKNGNVKWKKVPYSIHVAGMGVNPCLSIPTSKEGIYSTSDGIMRIIERETKNPDVKQYCILQKQAMMYKKAATTYCQAFLDRNIGGILYPNFNNTLTVTGRLSSSAPNFQNIAKRNQFGKTLHRLFIAPPGWKCVQVDYAQLEIWVLAWLSQDPILIEDLLSGIDMHCVRLQYYNQEYTYEDLYKFCKIDKDEYWSKERDKAKTLSYQKAYGAQAKKISEETGLDIEVVKLIMQKEDERYQGAASLLERVTSSIKQTATISKAVDIPSSKKGNNKDSSKVINGVEMLPIFDKSGNITYTDTDVRQVGYWKSLTGRKYSFLDTGRYYKGVLNRSFSFTQPKNYPMQGTGADVQAAAAAAILKALVSKSDVIKQVNEVHDSRWLYIREDKLHDAIFWIKKTVEDVPKMMFDRFGLDVPFKFPVEIQVGDNFADMEVYDI